MDSLRSALQPITHALPAPIHELGTSIIGDVCYKTLVLDINLESTECLKLAISKGLGLGIIAASSIVKIPQILKLLSSKSSSGISFLSYFLETSAYLISLAYNYRQGFPFSTYGETALIAVQNVVIAVLVLNYSGKSAGAAVYFQAGAGVLGVASKLPQIAAVWQEGGTGQLSAFAVFNYLIGSLSRIFTTLQEVDDKLILYGFIAGFALNAILAAQMVYYWNAPAKKSEKAKGKMPIKAGSGAGSSTATPKAKSPTTRRRG
ncbi:Mannose-P-dolichol utilization defect 1 protein-like protein [Lachnellula subtilissima]|uniref:Mannose-P-dolichol utilization defect 1 protein homolog n=1 Tax=Lachnellula subtilissima TaxID=602034 RepID=A0A8H8UAH1_9HELO|nr:Mannose-P-dolichol utilization defect 1 protein-like protein [Lachnellula subtilissima]